MNGTASARRTIFANSPETRRKVKCEKPAADVAGLFDGHRRPVDEKVVVNAISLDCNFPRMYASHACTRRPRAREGSLPPPSSSHERSIRENPSRFPRGTDVTRATADARRRRRRRRRHERFDVRPALVETRGAHRRPTERRDDDARDDATANGYPKIMSRRSTARKTEPTRAYREPND